MPVDDDEIDRIEPRDPVRLGLIEGTPEPVTDVNAVETARRWRETQAYLTWLFARWRKDHGWVVTRQDYEWQLTDVDVGWATFEKFDSPYAVRLSELYALEDQ